MANDEITKKLSAAASGDDAAAQAIWDAYSDKLLKYARKKMAAMPRRAVDEEDVVLSAMNSFFTGARAGKFEPKGRNELWKLLATITVRKATKHLRRHYADKRGGGQVRGESAFIDAVNPDESPAGINQVMDQDNLGEMSGELIRVCEERLSTLEDPALREIAILKLEGYRTSEIADKLNLSRATIKRRLVRIRELWSPDAS